MKLIQDDCLNAINTLKKAGIVVDAIITDPPFFMPATHYQSRVNWPKSWSDTSILATWWECVIKASKSIIAPDGHFLTFCNGESYPVFYPVMFSLFDKLKCIVWDKGRVGLGHIWRNQHELIIAARNKGHKVIEDGILRPDIIKCKATPSKNRRHPVEKPVELLRWLIASITNPGDTVLDLFMGGGSTGEAALRSGRNFIGVESDEKYFKIAEDRLNDV